MELTITWYTAVETAMRMAGYFAIYMLGNQLFVHKEKLWKILLTVVAMEVYSVVIWDWVVNSPYESALRIVCTLIGICGPYFILFPKERLSKKLFYACLVSAVSMFGVALASFFNSLVTGSAIITLDRARSIQQLFGTGLELVSYLVLLYLVVRWMNRHKNDHKISWTGFSLFMLSQYLLYFSALTFAFLMPNLTSMNVLAILIGVVVCLIADVLLFLNIRRSIEGARAEAENVALRQIRDIQSRYSMDLQDQFRRDAISRHDIDNHLYALNVLFAQDLGKAKAYLDTIIRAREEHRQMLYCNDSALNAVLNMKALTAKDKDIRLEVSIALPDVPPIDAVDLVSILANLLDNAIAGCDEIENSDVRAIMLEMGTLAGCLRIRCENPCAKTIRFEHGLPVRPPQDGKGTGVSSIMEVVRKHRGEAVFEQQDQRFSARIALPMAAIS